MSPFQWIRTLGVYLGCFTLFQTLCYSASKDLAFPISPEQPPEQIPREILYSDQILQTATRSVQHVRRVTDNVTVVTREELDRWPVEDLDEALGLISGIAVQDDGHIGQTATVQIYGSKEREVRVMIDGVTMNPTTSGWIADLSQIPLDLVEKIEIVKGASSSVWGSSLGGVINIVTRPVGKTVIPKVNGSMSFGEFDTERYRGEVSGAAGLLRYFGFGSYVESGGFRPHSDVLEKRSLIKAELPVTEYVNLNGFFGYSDSTVSEFDLPRVSFSSDRQVITRYGSAGANSHFGNFNLDAAYKISERSFNRTRRNYPALTDFRFFRTRSLVHEVSIHGVYDFSEHQTFVLGSDVGVDGYKDSQTLGATPFWINKSNTRHAYYGNYQFSWHPVDATLGSRIDVTNGYGTNFDPSVGAVYHLPFWNTLARGNVSRAFNAPSLVDRYLSVGTTVANPDLKAEHAIVYNLGLETEPLPKIRGKAVFFQTFLRDSILSVRRSDGLRQAVNINKERRTGFEAETKLGPWFGFSPSYAAVLTYAVDQNGVPVPSRPRLTHDIKLNFTQTVLDFIFNAHAAGRHMDLVTYADSGFTDPIDQALMVSGKVMLTSPEVQHGRITIFLEGANLFSQDFGFDGSNDPAPRRHFEAGFKISFEP